MVKTIEEIEFEKSIREDQSYRDAVNQLQKDVVQILELLSSMKSSAKTRNRFVITTCISVFVVLFAGVFSWVSTAKTNTATHEQIYKDKADRDAVNHSADWLKALDIKTGLNYAPTYYDLVRIPPERTRGGKAK